MDWFFAAAPVLNFAGGLFGMSSAKEAAQKQFENNLFMMDRQHDYNVDDYMHRYKWATMDMRNSGLNPILAATNGIGGSINGVSAPSAAMASTPDFSRLGDAFTSAYQVQSNKEIAKMQNDVAKEQLRLDELRINNAKEKQDNDIKIDNMMADIKKWSIEQENKRAWLMNDAQIENLKETLRIQEEHFIRSDQAAYLSAEAHLASAGAAWFSAQVQDRLADVAEKTGFTQQELNTAHKILMDTQARDAAAIAEWHEYLNDHPKVRGAVGFISSFLDVAGLAYKSSGYGKTFSDGVQSGW